MADNDSLTPSEMLDLLTVGVPRGISAQDHRDIVASINKRIDDAGGGGLVKIGATSLAMYSDNLPSGITEANLGLRSTDLQSIRSTKATGNIRFGSNPLDGETLTIGDGVNTVVFEFDDGGGVAGGNTPVLIGVDNIATAVNFFAALSASILTIIETGLVAGFTWWRFVENTVPGETGNVLMTDTSAGITTSGLSGAVDHFGVADDATLLGNLCINTITALKSVVIGSDVRQEGSHSVAIGTNIWTLGHATVVIGDTSSADGAKGVAIGDHAQCSEEGDIGIGNTVVQGPFGIAIGDGSFSWEEAITIGHGSNANDLGAIAIGASVQADGFYSIAMGFDSRTRDDDSIAIGRLALTSLNAIDAIAIGRSSNAREPDTIAVGRNSIGDDINCVAIGLGSYAWTSAVGIGDGANAYEVNSIAIGTLSDTTGGDDAIAVGAGATATHARSVALGKNAATTAIDQIVLGTATHSLSTPGNVSLGGVAKTVGFYGSSGVVQGAKVADPVGGGTVDTECRTQLGILIDRLEATNLLAAV
jgi:hypothetical protein